MAGMNLRIGGFGTAAVPVASNQPEGTTINQAAFGIYSSQTGAGPATAGFGTVALGVGGAILLTWLWYTLPR